MMAARIVAAAVAAAGPRRSCAETMIEAKLGGQVPG